MDRVGEEKANHEERLALYEEFEWGLEAELREGRISKEAYLGTKLTLARGLGAEMSYVEWCEEAAKMISSLEQHPMDGPRTS
jgi:hypothetical protein